MQRQMMKGNEAIAEAAVQAGCRFFFGYPITPQNEVPEYLSRYMLEEGKVFVQAESEVAAINMVYGAAGAGGRCAMMPLCPHEPRRSTRLRDAVLWGSAALIVLFAHVSSAAWLLDQVVPVTGCRAAILDILADQLCIGMADNGKGTPSLNLFFGCHKENAFRKGPRGQDSCRVQPGVRFRIKSTAYTVISYSQARRGSSPCSRCSRFFCGGFGRWNERARGQTL